MAVNYLLFAGQLIQDEILLECTECGEKWTEKGNVAIENTECKKCNSNKIELDGPLMMPGLFSWVNAFRDHGGKGVMRATFDRNELESFDIIHVNITPGHPSYVQALRRALGQHSSTKIIANVDYAVSMWGNIDPYVLEAELRAADTVFHVESTGAARVGRMLNRKVHCIPHPVDTVRLKKLKNAPFSEPTITCQYHRYWGTWSVYYYALRDMKWNVRSILCNLPNNSMPPLISPEVYFGDVCGVMPHQQYITDVLSKAYINLDAAPDKTFGRGVIEAAVLGVPTVGTASIEAMGRLFPSLRINDPDDEIQMRYHIEHLLKDPEFYRECMQQGKEQAEHYNNKNSYKRMMNAVEVSEYGGIQTKFRER